MISFLEYLVELFDRPWSLKEIYKGKLYDVVKHQLKKDFPEATRVFLYQATDNNGNDQGYVLEYVYKGAVEIHHINKDFMSGEMIENPTKPNPKFIATMKERILYYSLRKRMTVRVIGVGSMIFHYEKIGKNIISKHKGILMGKLRDYPHPHYNNVKSFTIRPKSKFNLDEFRESMGKELE